LQDVVVALLCNTIILAIPQNVLKSTHSTRSQSNNWWRTRVPRPTEWAGTYILRGEVGLQKGYSCLDTGLMMVVEPSAINVLSGGHGMIKWL